MEDISFLGAKAEWHLLEIFGITNPLFNVAISTVVNTWIVMALLCLFTYLARIVLKNKKNYFRFCVLELIKGFMNLTRQTLGSFIYKHFSFITALFLFILACNLTGVVPFLEEPTVDLNTTVGLALIGLFYRDFYAIKEHGFWGYIKEFFQPVFIMAPLHIMGKLSSLVSISFRLFGNILAGAIISHIYFSFAKTSIILNLVNFCGLSLVISLFFGVFEGLIQAFVFAMLSLTYLSLVLAHNEDTEKVLE